VALCRLEEIADPGTKGFQFREGDALFAGFVVRRGDAVAGYVDSCPHAGWPLALAPDRYLTREKDLILCSGHGALFRPEDGVCVAGPCAGNRLAAWPVTVVGGEVVTA
jgi:nitrite reductase/ring-hydroxylating ferredoxin subunit